jgi:hypothetical protein
LFDELQAQPRPAEVAAVFDAQAFDIDFDPVGPRVVEELFLACFRVAFGGVLNTQPMGFIELSEIGDDTSSWPAWCDMTPSTPSRRAACRFLCDNTGE